MRLVADWFNFYVKSKFSITRIQCCNVSNQHVKNIIKSLCQIHHNGSLATSNLAVEIQTLKQKELIYILLCNWPMSIRVAVASKPTDALGICHVLSGKSVQWPMSVYAGHLRSSGHSHTVKRELCAIL